MRAAALLVLLLASGAHAQGFGGVFPGGGGGAGGACTLSTTSPALAPYYRATTTAAEPGFQCDAVNATCVKFGPGVDNIAGSNASGETIFGRVGVTTGVVRFYGTAIGFNVTATNVLTYNAALDQGNTAFARNTNSGRPYRIADAEGLLVDPSTTLQACNSTTHGTLKPLSFAASSGTRTRLCVCTSDHAATPVFRWQNVVTGTVGTTDTECLP